MRVETNKNLILICGLWGTMIGILIGIGFSFLAVQTYCGTCPEINLAQVLFPYSLIVDPAASSDVGILVAGIQWPFYGVIISVALSSLSKKKALLIVCFLIILHAFSMKEANRRVNAHWAPKLNSQVYVNARAAI
jgi:hypothetical protein